MRVDYRTDYVTQPSASRPIAATLWRTARWNMNLTVIWWCLFVCLFVFDRCTVKSACQKATTSSPRWLAYGSGQQCIDFEQVLPDRIPISQTAVVSSSRLAQAFINTRAEWTCSLQSSAWTFEMIRLQMNPGFIRSTRARKTTSSEWQSSIEFHSNDLIFNLRHTVPGTWPSRDLRIR